MCICSPTLAPAGGLDVARIFEEVGLTALLAELTAEAVCKTAAVIAPNERLLGIAPAFGVVGGPRSRVVCRPRPVALDAIVAT